MRIEPRRGAWENDLGPVVELWVAAWSEAMPSIDFGARRAWFVERCAEHRRQGGVLILCGGAVPAGLSAFAMVLPRTRTLDQLAVAPACQGQGLARALIEEAKRLCGTGLELQVNTGNGRAIRLYRSCGFKVTAEGTNALSGLPILTMAWTP